MLKSKRSLLSKGMLAAVVAAVLALGLFALMGCGGAGESAADESAAAAVDEPTTTRTITDVVGREVEIPASPENIIAIGVGGPRMAAYLDVMDLLVGAEDSDIDEVVVLRDYNPVWHDWLATLPSVGQGGGSGNNNAYPEEIIKLAPDVIIAGFDLEAADELQAQTNIPVVSIRHNTGLATDSQLEALRVFAEVVGAQDRYDELTAFIADMKADLDARTADIPDADKPSVYAGAVTWNGRRGFAGTYADFGPLVAVHADNVADQSGMDGFFEADFEAIVVWDPDVIFLDPGNMDLVNAEYAANPDYFSSLRAVRDGRVYTMPAFNFAGTNLTYAFINAYFAGITLYPEAFADITIEDKAADILTMFLGEDTSAVMADGGLFYGPLTIGQ
ncbi:MAG: ABC transporter substrate-binding protein [Coriobacteriia bacterium]|nr:ABC transporter substrate-binding protein [Coriobacteriia bacterium]